MLISIDSIITFPMKWWMLMTFKKPRNTAGKHHRKGTPHIQKPWFKGRTIFVLIENSMSHSMMNKNTPSIKNTNQSCNSKTKTQRIWTSGLEQENQEIYYCNSSWFSHNREQSIWKVQIIIPFLWCTTKINHQPKQPEFTGQLLVNAN